MAIYLTGVETVLMNEAMKRRGRGGEEDGEKLTRLDSILSKW